MSEELFTTTQAAKLAGTSPSRVRQMIANGQIPVRSVGTFNLLDIAAIELIKARKTAPGPAKGQTRKPEAVSA